MKSFKIAIFCFSLNSFNVFCMEQPDLNAAKKHYQNIDEAARQEAGDKGLNPGQKNKCVKNIFDAQLISSLLDFAENNPKILEHFKSVLEEENKKVNPTNKKK